MRPNWLLSLALLPACESHPRDADITHHLGTSVVDGGYALMSVGDSLTFQVDSSECHGDVCDSTTLDAASFEWSMSPGDVATLDPASRTVWGVTPGVAVVTAKRGERTASDSVRIYPRVAQLAWAPRPQTAVAGDTLRASVVAKDAAGREVARLPAHTISGGTGTAGQLLDWGGNASGAGPGPTIVWLDRPGTLTLVARLAHRWDTLTIQVDSLLAPADSVPGLGARVRVIAPSLGDSVWHLGMFNQLRMPPACYRVLLFGRSLTIAHTLASKDLTRMQVAVLSASVPPPAFPRGKTRSEEFHARGWREVPLTLVQREEHCPERVQE